jgi:preprotein translocase subunit YajC
MATIIFLGLFVLMWIVLIVPRQREIRRHQALVAQLAEGDEVMLGSGIYGVITALEDDFVRLDVAPGVELKVAKRAVAAKVAPPQVVDVAGVDNEADDDHADGPDALDEPSPDVDLSSGDRPERVDRRDVAGN